MNRTLPVSAIVVSLMLTGCVAPAELVKRRVNTGIAEASRAKSEPVLQETNSPYLRAQASDYSRPAGGGVTLSVERAPLLATVRSLAQQAGYEVTVVGNVDTRVPVSVSFRQLDAESAIREVAFAGGVVPIIDRTRHIVSLANEGVYTFRIPVGVLKSKNVDASVSNSLGTSAGGGAGGGSSNGGGGQGGGSGGSSDGSDNATVSVQAKHEYKVDTVVEHLKSVLSYQAAGRVKANTETGMISVAGSANDLRRARDFIETWLRDALTVVDIEATVLDIGLTDQFQMGFDWTKVLSGTTNGSVKILNSASSIVDSPSFDTAITRNSVSGVIKALRKITDVNVLVRYHGRPNNHAPAILTNAEQVPYLPSVTTNTTSGSGSATVQASGSLAFAMQGLSFATIPHVISNQYVDVTLVPLIARIDGFSKFNLPGGTQLVGPLRPVTDGYLNTTVESGKTTVIAGSNTGTVSKMQQGVPGLMDIPGLGELVKGRANKDEQRGTVILVHANVIPAPRIDALIGESL
ncbi:hypothetical protein HA052_04965 [Chromobacterium haemolyticum]|uniref:Type II/III secretion system secretin-like domain-containing protein n=1 Tax=Chromobacterium fluminis TaxID=3044269 RepID=A0ABX0L4H5_9NEIS|nr:hypothetical protein [Chromobacterium haemolyticum]